jgi:selenide,water dikinase
MNLSPFILKDVVLVGGGHAHVHVIKMFGMKPMPGVRVTLVTKDVITPYSGMLPAYVSGIYSHDECHIDLGVLCSWASVRLIQAEVCNIRTGNLGKEVHCTDGRPPIPYDVLSVDIGISPASMPGIDDFSNITPVKPIDGFARRWDVILSRVLQSDGQREMNLVVVGGGAGGTELAFAIKERLNLELKKLLRDSSFIKVSLVNRGGELVSSHGKGVRDIIMQKAKAKNISIYLDCEILTARRRVGINDPGTELVAADGRVISFDEAIWCTQAAGQSWLKNTGLETTSEGFVVVKPTLESANVPGVFACGDISHNQQHPRPKAGVFAVRAGPPVNENIRRFLLGQDLEPWEPQDQFLGIIGTGTRHGIASKGALAVEGGFLFTLKDKIDVTWMDTYGKALPDKEEMMKKMAEQQASSGVNVAAAGNEALMAMARASGQDETAARLLKEAAMRCGGCGSKVGSSVLSRALARLRRGGFLAEGGPTTGAGSAGGESVLVAGIGDDAALVKPAGQGMLQVHTIDYFRSFINDPFVFGQIAMIHALSDCHAMNADAQTALAMCVLPYGPPSQTEALLIQLLAGACKVLREDNCCLAGGHTSEGAELALGFAVNGVADPGSWSIL